MDSAFEARMAAILDQALGSSGAPLVAPAPMSVLPALDTHLPMSGSGSHFLEQSGIGAGSDGVSNIMLWGGLALVIVVYVGWWMIQDNDANESDGEDDENGESETDKSEDDSNRSESMQNQNKPRRRKPNSSPLTTEEEMFFRH